MALLVIFIICTRLSEKKREIFKNKKFKRNNLFELFVVENEKKYLKKSKKFMEKIFYIKVHFHFSNVKMTNYQGNIVTEYDFLYATLTLFILMVWSIQRKGNINGISTRHYDMMPMICDILKIEYFLVQEQSLL